MSIFNILTRKKAVAPAPTPPQQKPPETPVLNDSGYGFKVYPAENGKIVELHTFQTIPVGFNQATAYRDNCTRAFYVFAPDVDISEEVAKLLKNLSK